MGRLIIRSAVYFAILSVFTLLFGRVTGTIPWMLLGALVLALVNTVIRPVFTALALPANLLTLGIASIFVNMLTIVIADAMIAPIAIQGFWVILLMAVTVMIADMILRTARKEIGRKRVFSV